MTWWWGFVASVALLWPDHMTSWFDGAPLDRPAEVIAVAVVFPMLCGLYPAFLTTRRARVLITALVLWRAFSAFVLVPEGLCVRLQPARTYVIGQRGAPHSWDVRADWRTPDPVCSAIMTRSYTELAEFPVWFFNLPPVGDGSLAAADRPPDAVTSMTVSGFLHPRQPGLLHVDSSDGISVAIRIDGGPEADAPRLLAGTHAVSMTTTLTGDRWRFAPLWNNRSPWSTLLPTVRRGSSADVFVRRWMRWLPDSLVLMLLVSWIYSWVRSIDELGLVQWAACASIVLVTLVLAGLRDEARVGVAALSLAALVPVSRRHRTAASMIIAIGIPWIAYVVARAFPTIGRFTLYEWGNDFWTFQRYAYRIALQGFWLEGGSATFWFQPLYRWVAAVLHLAFGDSSAGEILWDGACLLAGALWAYHAVQTRARFAWSVVAASASLAVFILGTPRDLIGRGLGEITSAGFLYVSAALAMRRRMTVGSLLGAGACAVLGFYTRLNNLPMAAAVAAFAIPSDVRTRDVLVPWKWLPRVSVATVAAIGGALIVGMVLFAARTWYYTGIFSLFYGTQRQYLTLWPEGASLHTVVTNMVDSLLMVVSVNDPPRWDPYALPVVAGAAACLGAMLGIPRLRDLPLSIVVFAVGSVGGSLIARGSAYPGRFSIHVLPLMSTACALGIAAIVPALRDDGSVIGGPVAAASVVEPAAAV